jgi:vitamin B12 transporter
VFGVDTETAQFRDAVTARKTASQSSGHALLDYSAGGFNLAGGLRYDHHDSFGGHWTYGANASLALARHLRARVSYGEGFKSPTLYQLNAFGNDYGFLFAGNPALKPELSHSYEAGLDYGQRGDAFHAAVTLFRRDSTNLISFVSCDSSAVGICAAHLGDFAVGTYANIGKARADGYELEADWRPADPLVLQGHYSFVKSYNRTLGDWYFGRDLARRPRHALNLAADWRTPLHDLSLGADLRVVSSSYDSQFSNQQLHGYALMTLRASVPLGQGMEIYGRVENLTDTQYQTAAGYATAGRSAYLGARARF